MNKLTLGEVTFLSYSGLIKGVICYALALEFALENATVVNELTGNTYHVNLFSKNMKSILHNCILGIVILTTIFCGSFMSLIRRCLLGDAKEKAEKAEAEKIAEI